MGVLTLMAIVLSNEDEEEDYNHDCHEGEDDNHDCHEEQDDAQIRYSPFWDPKQPFQPETSGFLFRSAPKGHCSCDKDCAGDQPCCSSQGYCGYSDQHCGSSWALC